MSPVVYNCEIRNRNEKNNQVNEIPILRNRTKRCNNGTTYRENFQPI